MTVTDEFWLHKTLEEMAEEEWELLCDGCGLCCLHKLEDIDTKELFFTNVACRYLDLTTCRCTCYSNRIEKAEGCINLTSEKVTKLKWLPESCAYRRLSEGKSLQWWHPLISKNKDSVHRAGISVRTRCLSEKDIDIDRLEDYIINWLK